MLALRSLYTKSSALIWFLFDSLPAQHACTQACHAPSICPEDRPCHSLLTLACSCGRIRQAVHCGRNSSNTAGAQRTPPRCNNDCSIAQRNARLADALGITPGEKVTAVTYHEDLVTFAKADHKFLGLVEKAFVEYASPLQSLQIIESMCLCASRFVNSNKKTQVLPHMPPERRQFVRSVSSNPLDCFSYLYLPAFSLQVCTGWIPKW
jgi:transcriptional repressor NF-X1